jgi:hypothetical protein
LFPGGICIFHNLPILYHMETLLPRGGTVGFKA